MIAKINEKNSSTLRNLVMIMIPNNFGKHVNRISQQKKIVIIQENIMLLEKDKLLQNKRIKLQFSRNISDQLQAP